MLPIPVMVELKECTLAVPKSLGETLNFTHVRQQGRNVPASLAWKTLSSAWSLKRRMLCGLMSRWRIPSRCRWYNPEQISVANVI